MHILKFEQVKSVEICGRSYDWKKWAEEEVEQYFFCNRRTYTYCKYILYSQQLGSWELLLLVPSSEVWGVWNFFRCA